MKDTLKQNPQEVIKQIAKEILSFPPGDQNDILKEVREIVKKERTIQFQNEEERLKNLGELLEEL